MGVRGKQLHHFLWICGLGRIWNERSTDGKHGGGHTDEPESTDITVHIQLENDVLVDQSKEHKDDYNGADDERYESCTFRIRVERIDLPRKDGEDVNVEGSHVLVRDRLGGVESF